jgi:hypothetical protein
MPRRVGDADAGRMSLRRINWAALFAVAYGLLALHWTAGGGGFPFGAGDPDPGIDKGLSLLGGVHRSTAAPVIAAVAFGAALVAWRLRGRLGEYAAWAVAVTLGVIVPDYRPLVAMGHVPVLLAGKPFGWPEGVSIASQLPWPVLHQGILMAGGALFARAALTLRRARLGSSMTPDQAARWGRVAVWVAAAVPVGYAATRFAWAFGIPLGFSTDQLRDMDEEMPGIWWGGAALAGMGLAGSVLTFGLIRPWGERFPRWIPVLRGRRVPVPLAVVPALVVAAAVTSAGLMFARVLYLDPDPGKLAMMGPGLLWPVWGAALAFAAVAYGVRRRGGRPAAPVQRDHEAPAVDVR